MIKKAVKKVAMVGAAIFALVGAAHAADININIYGASAEYKFWNDAADNYLLSKGCTGVVQAQDSTHKHGITMGTCNSGADTVYIRYSAKASFDGIRSMQGIDPDNVDACSTVDMDSDGTPDYDDHYRYMADETNTDWGTGTVNSLACKDVNIGASDVEAGAFRQESHGFKYGNTPIDPADNPWIDRAMDQSTIYDTGLTAYRPLVVPFGFIANNSVPYDNMSRMMAVHIYSGQVTNWNAFDPTQTSQDITACLRHAGSGTHATLDAVVMNGAGNLMIYQNDDSAFGTVAWFNDGSSDMMRCIDQNAGAVGYADADQSNTANTKSMTYEGVAPSADTIENGQYVFWSAQWAFEDPTEAPAGSTLHTWIADLMSYASIGTNIPGSKSAYWAAQNDMKVTKGNSFAFPIRK